MSSPKEIHVVFQVLNFLTSSASHSYSLTSIEKMLIIILAKHHGPKGIYPSVKTLAKEMQQSDRNIRRLFLRLEEKGLLNIVHKKGRSSNYVLSEVIHTPDNSVSTDSLTPDNSVSTPLTISVPTPDNGVSLSIHKISKSNQYRERESRQHTSRPEIAAAIFLTKATFSFTHGECSEAIKRDIQIQDCFNRFWAYVQKTGKSNFERHEWERWLKRERNGPLAKNESDTNVVNLSPELKKCEKCDRWESHCRCMYSTKETAHKRLTEIFNQLGIRKNGEQGLCTS